MFINLSNHPSSTWSDKQKIAAQAYGLIHDMPFPNIDPHATSDQILQKAEKYLLEIRKLDPKAVHIMGELTFTFAMVKLLQQVGYLCLAATSDRNVEVIDDKKVISFNFVQFRPYILL